jgi:glycosyltransferase involved in cell wall biosynthesis
VKLVWISLIFSCVALFAEDKPFVVVIASYNNEAVCHKNLRSVIEQEYTAYRVIYIDDCSTDRTYERVEQFIKDHHCEDKFTLIRNEKRLGAMENFYRAIHSCKDEEIVAVLDGDDWFSNERVLAILNGYYAKPKVWMTYGSYVYYPTYHKGECSKRIPEKVWDGKGIRHHSQKGVITSHLKTFYAALFKKIRLEDVTLKGEFLSSTWDMAAMFPMLEMCGKRHARFVPEVLYVNNRSNPLNDDKVNFEAQQTCWKHVLSSPPYERVCNGTMWERHEEALKADLIIFSYDRPMQLLALLESAEKELSSLGMKTVIYRASSDEYAAAYQEVETRFGDISFVKQSETPHQDFKPLVMKTLERGSPYVCFAVDDIIIKDRIDLAECIKSMQESGAYGFYLRLGRHVDQCYMLNRSQAIPQAIALEKGVHAWEFGLAEGDWGYPHSLDMTLYRKDDVKKAFEKLDFIHPNSLEAAWAMKSPLHRIGLCYEHSKIVNIPLNLVNVSSNRNMNLYTAKELLELFNAGKKIDIAPLYQICNRSAHMDYEPIFIAR